MPWSFSKQKHHYGEIFPRLGTIGKSLFTKERRGTGVRGVRREMKQKTLPQSQVRAKANDTSTKLRREDNREDNEPQAHGLWATLLCVCTALEPGAARPLYFFLSSFFFFKRFTYS